MVTPSTITTRLHLDPQPQKISGSEIYACQMEVTPKLAADWLERYNKKNRNPRQSKVSQYTSDILSNRFLLTHQGIAFDQEGEIISGQHRLYSVVAANKAILSLIFINCCVDERKAIDQTASRTVQDVGRLGYGEDMPIMISSIVKAMNNGIAIKKAYGSMSIQDVYEFFNTHRKAIEFVTGNISRRVPGVISACSLAAICRAFYYLKRADIKRFVEILVSGITEVEEDQIIVQLRNILLEKRNNLRDYEGRRLTYCLTETALQAYAARELPKRLVGTKTELFELPSVK